MRLKKLLKNQKGIGHHIIFPLLVILAVAAVGGYVLIKSRAATQQYTFHKGDFGITPGSGFLLTAKPGDSASEAQMANELRDFNNLGVRWIRSTIPWGNIQPDDPGSGGAYNWKGVDELEHMLDHYNNGEFAGKFRVIVTFENPPGWAVHPKADPAHGKNYAGIGQVACNKQPPFDVINYANAVAALAGHLKNDQNVRAIELGNEPNIGLPGGATSGDWEVANPCAYTAALKAAYTAVHGTTNNPGPRPGIAMPDGINILTAGVGGGRTVPQGCVYNPDDPHFDPKSANCQQIPMDNFLKGIYANGGKDYFDGVSSHSYSSPDLPCDPAQVDHCVYNPSTQIQSRAPYGRYNGWDLMLNMRNTMVAHNDTTTIAGRTKRIWITEFGVNTPAVTDPKNLNSNLVSSDTYSNEEKLQAKIITAAYQRATQESWIGPLCIYTYQDGARAGHNGWWEGLKRMPGLPPAGTQLPGMSRTDLNKPAYGAYQSLSSTVKNVPNSAAEDLE